MRTSHPRLFAALAASVLLFAGGALPPSSPVRAQQRPRAIDTYAITGARIVTVGGATIERGTVVVRDGLIAAVGAGATAPADARVIDGAGLTVYPGFIDANTTLGIPAPTPTPSATGAANPFAGLFGPSVAPSATSPNSSQPPGLQPEILAADIIRPGGDQIEAARNAGLTAALSAPRGNIFLGQSVLINLAGDTPQAMIVRSPVALHVGFTPLSAGRYPGSLMGVFASIRQMLLDAQRYREANAIYDRNPRGLRRPEHDKSLAALVPVLAREVPVVMQAEREREIRRALDLAKEFNLRLIIAGGAESWKVADRLRAENVPVLLSLNFPKRTTAQLAEADPEPLRLLRDREDAPRTAGRLASAGVRFAFQSGGMTAMADYLSNAARTVENGLGRDEAIRALTLRPSEILGLADRLGTIEVGKIANLTVTRGDLFDRNRSIAHVFIDGRPVDLKPAATSTGSGVGASGTWSLRLNTGGAGQSEVSITLLLQQQGEQLQGSIQGALGSKPIANASLGAGGEIRFTVPVTIDEQTTEAIFSGTLAGNEMSGTLQIVGRGPGTFTGSRTGSPPSSPNPLQGTPQARPDARPPGEGTTPGGATTTADISGTWTINFAVGGRSTPATLTLRQQGASLAGTLQSSLGGGEITGGSTGADGFRFTIPLEFQGRTVEFTFTGTTSGNRMSGTVSSPDSGAVPFSGTKP